jgi:predicted aminopeptidase
VTEQRRLERAGYDVQLRGVPAYSLGGWLPDPVYSPLLEGSRYRVADTVIHELTHGTVFLPGRAAFNEGLATFVGDHGAMDFLVARYGEGSATVRAARREAAESSAYSALLHELALRLRALYAAPIARDTKLARREAVFAEGRARLAALAFQSPRFARLARRPLNNAVLATHEVYFGASAPFDAVYARCGRDLARFVRYVHDVVARAPEPEAFLRSGRAGCAR